MTDKDTTTALDSHFDDAPTSSNSDPRHQRRIELMQQLFAYSFTDTHPDLKPELHDDLAPLLDQLTQIDELIQSFAPERPLTEINKVDLAILRLVVFESKQKKTPKKVLIDEAVELAKEFGTESSPKFVNGVLAHILLPEA
jgi:N utilization substance protein B